MNRIQLLLSTSVLGCAVLVQPALSQNASGQAAASAAASSSDDQSLQEVVVTAERKVNTAQKTAAAISVRSGDDMQAQGRYELKNILEDVPGVDGGAATHTSSTQAGGTDNPASGLIIRGVQSNGGAGGSITSTAAAAAIYVDEVYSGIGGGYDIDRVEVLRGPQGTLYGRSATSGVVAIHTGDPDTARFGAKGAVEFGNYNLSHVSAYVNVPIVDEKLALRLSGDFYDRDGYYSAEGGALTNKNFRAKALWAPTDNFSLVLGYAQENIETNTGGVSISQAVGSPDIFIYTPQVVSPPGKNKSQQYWANFKLDLGPVELTYIPAYRTWYGNVVVYGRGAFNADQTLYTPDDSFTTHELRIRNADTASKLQWQAGFLIYDNTLSNVNNLYTLGGPPPPGSPPGTPPSPPGYAFQSSTDKSTSAEGVFAEATYSFAPETRLTAGTRYDHTQIRNSQIYSAFGGPPATLTGDEGLRTFDNVTYRLRLEHDLTPQNLLYGSISTGFSPGDITLTTDATFQPVVQVLEDQTLTAYEVGSKNRYLENRLQVNAAVFYNDYGAFQTAGINTSPQTPQTPTFNTIALPMTSYGAELEVDSRPTPNGRLSVTAAYVHARYDDFGQYAYLFAQHEVPGVAPFQASVAYDHRIPLGRLTLLVRGALRYASAHYTSIYPPPDMTTIPPTADAGPYLHVSAQTIGDLNATLSFSQYSITAYVRNIADSRFIPDGWGATTVGVVNSFGAALSDPRTFGAMFTAKF